MFKTKIIQKGQIFSTDFLMSMIIIILIIGTIINTMEVNNFQNKEKTTKIIMEQKTNLAFNILLTSKEFNCDINGLHLTNTIDENKLNTNLSKIKEILGLEEYGLEIKIDNQSKHNSLSQEKNTLNITSNIKTCTNSSNLNFNLDNCRTTSCFEGHLITKEIKFLVGQ